MSDAARKIVREWLKWMRDVGEASNIDLASLTAVVPTPKRDVPQVLLRVDPDVLESIIDELEEAGLDTWPDALPRLRAWRLLSIDLMECVDMMEDDAEEVTLTALRIEQSKPPLKPGDWMYRGPGDDKLPPSMEGFEPGDHFEWR
jgi:hypothetical protein